MVARGAGLGWLYISYPHISDTVTAIAWSPDGTHIASGDDDGIVHVWQAPVASQYAPGESGQSEL
jgi:WD40 repeat protein